MLFPVKSMPVFACLQEGQRFDDFQPVLDELAAVQRLFCDTAVKKPVTLYERDIHGLTHVITSLFNGVSCVMEDISLRS